MLVAIGILAVAVFVWSVRAVAVQAPGGLGQLAGAICLIGVVVAHIAERYALLPSMGWGRPDSAGHYFDLVNAILALILLPLGFGLGWRSRRRPSQD